jgi:hypothetical protein
MYKKTSMDEKVYMERSIDIKNVQIQARRNWKFLVDEDSIVIVNSNNIEPKVVKITDTQKKI